VRQSLGNFFPHNPIKRSVALVDEFSLVFNLCAPGLGHDLQCEANAFSLQQVLNNAVCYPFLKGSRQLKSAVTLRKDADNPFLVQISAQMNTFDTSCKNAVALALITFPLLH